MTGRNALILLILIFFVLSHCRGNRAGVGKPWRSEESQFFDDGVDLVKSYASLSGEWAYRYKNWLEARIQLADVIAIVEITSVQTKTDVHGQQVKRVDVAVLENLYGKPASTQLSLESQENAPGHELILRYERHLSGEFVLFGRWFAESEAEELTKEVGHHFHLSVSTEALLNEVKGRVASRKKEEGKSKTVEAE
jgi:hypothetical protein